MIIFDEVINDIEENIAAYPAERGGLLFGPSGRDVIALFVPDKTAHTSSVTYTISKEMSVKAPEIERTTNLEYKGVIHSHPSSFDRPSSGDHAAAANALKLNPHMCRFFMPILTAQHDGMEIRRHELAINHSKIGGFAAIRGKGKSKVTMLEIPMYSVPAYKYLQETCRRLVSDKIAKIANVVGRARLMPRDGVLNIAYTLNCDSKTFFVIAGEAFPQYAPHILDFDGQGITKEVSITWSINCDPVEAIVEALKKAIYPSVKVLRYRPGSKRWLRERKKMLKRRHIRGN